MQKIVLEVNDIVKNYVTKYHGRGKKMENPAVQGVSFVLHQGETLGIVGESGCGKSTIAKMLVKLLTPDRGEIFLNGEEIGHISDRKFRSIRPQIQLIQQNPFGCMDPRMKIWDILSEGIKVHRIDTGDLSMHQYVTEALEDCGLKEEHLMRYPNEFSGGQLQRLSIVRAILLKPCILIADEIVSALDVSIQGQILRLLMRLKEERQLSLLFITHDLSVVRKISDRILVMKKGGLLEEGTPEYIFEGSKHPYIEALKTSIIPFPY